MELSMQMELLWYQLMQMVIAKQEKNDWLFLNKNENNLHIVSSNTKISLLQKLLKNNRDA